MSQFIKMAGVFVLLALVLSPLAAWGASSIRGHYLEARTCQVYTGPCFANSEVGLTGKDAVMAWSVSQGQHRGVDLAGLSVVVVVRAAETLAFDGLEDAGALRSMIVVDQKATAKQREALIDFAKEKAGKAGQAVVAVHYAPITMQLDEVELRGHLQAGTCVQLATRKAQPGDCICRNETAYYPPLARVEYFAPGVTVQGDVSAQGLGTRWSIPETRSAYMATFAYE
jgi:hypothetical protein